MAVDLVAGKALEALYAGVEEVIRKNRMFSKLCKDIKYSLDSLAPLIHQMAKYNQQLDRTKELEALEGLIKRGLNLVGKCSKLRNWNIYKKWKYSNEFLDFKEALQNELEVLKVQVARDVKKIEAGVDKIQDTVENIKQDVSILVKQLGNSEIEASGAILPELPDLIIGLDNPLKELKEKLLKEEVSMLIVTAPGGCGKTTLATRFCADQEIKDTFKKNIFFVTFSKKPNLELIMKGLYEQKGYTVPSNQNELTPLKWLNKVKIEEGDHPILLVLDDVWSGSDSLLEKFEFKISNYKVLVTSRSEFPRFGPSYHLQLLDNDNAMKLFRHTASLEDKSSHIPIDLSKEIVKRCNGFPLAIQVAGRSLCGQPEAMWRSRIDEWSKGSSILDFETELLIQLQSSIDVLDNAMPMVKECLLDLGAFPEDARIPVTALIDMWAELYDLENESSCIAKLYELKNRNLALLVEAPGGVLRVQSVQEAIDYSEDAVTQHDLLRELSIYNSRRDPMEQRERLIVEISGNNFPKWWREQKYPYINARLVSISTDEEFSEKFPNMQLPKAEVLVLNFQSIDYAIPEFVESMHKLKMLLVMSHSRDSAVLDNFLPLGSLSNLRILRLDGISISCISKIPVQMKNLHRLYLRRGFEEEQDFTNLSYVFPNLKEMVIESSSIKFTSVKEICKLIHLKKLKIKFSSVEKVSNMLLFLPEEMGNLGSLEVLSLQTFKHLIRVPDSIGNLKNLKFLEISGSPILKRLPEQLGELKFLRHLIISDCTELPSLPESIGDLVNLEVLCLKLCESLTKLPESVTSLKKLNFLDIDFCEKMKVLPHHIGELKSLRKLHMVGCRALRILPESVSDLEQLEQVITDDWHATHLWTPLSFTLKNLRIVVRKASRGNHEEVVEVYIQKVAMQFISAGIRVKAGEPLKRL